jgi:hypothetical protein
MDVEHDLWCDYRSPRCDPTASHSTHSRPCVISVVWAPEVQPVEHSMQAQVCAAKRGWVHTSTACTERNVLAILAMFRTMY